MMGCGGEDDDLGGMTEGRSWTGGAEEEEAEAALSSACFSAIVVEMWGRGVCEGGKRRGKVGT